MARGLILLLAALVVCVSRGVEGTGHLSFSNNTEVIISREGCGATKLCRETPTGCDPTGQGSCLFLSAIAGAPVAPNGFNLSVELSGNSSGYIALGLTADGTRGTSKLFICASNNGSFFFRTMTRNDAANTLAPNEMRVKEIRGKVTGSVIMCEFIIESLNATATAALATRTSHVTTFDATLGSGTTTGTTIGAFTSSLTTGPLNLRDNSDPTMAPPNANATMATATTTMATTTMATNTTMGNGGGAVQPHAVLLLSILTLSALLKA